MLKRLSLLFCLLPLFAAGQEAFLSIHAAVDSAFLNNAVLNQSLAQLKQKENEWRTLTGIEAPEISYLEEGRNRTAEQPFQERRWTISQTIDFPLTTLYRLKGIKREAEALEYQIDALKNEIRADVKSRYIDVLYALHLQKLGMQQKQLAEELYNAVYTKFETGMGNGIDLTKAELQVVEADNFLSDAERALHIGRYSLFRLMGLEISEINYGIQFSDSLSSNEVTVDQVTALSVLHDQPEYLAASRAAEATDYKIREAQSNILPDLRFNWYKQNYGGGYDFNGFEIGLSIPIWLPFEQSGKVKMAKARQEELAWYQKGIEQSVKEKIEHAWHSYSASKQVIDRYNLNMRDKSERLQQLSIRAYRLGKIDLMNLINARQIYLDSQKRYLDALRDYYLQLTLLERYLNLELVY